MRKAEQVRLWLDLDVPPKEIAKRVPCALSFVYQVKGSSGITAIRHQLAVITEELQEIRERLGVLECGPATGSPQTLSRGRAG